MVKKERALSRQRSYMKKDPSDKFHNSDSKFEVKTGPTDLPEVPSLFFDDITSSFNFLNQDQQIDKIDRHFSK